MKIIGLARLGKTAELRQVGDTCVANLALAYNYGKKAEDGNKPTQWLEASLWGNRAESLVQYLVKGQQLLVTVSDVHIETYQKSDGSEGSKLSGRVDDLEFAGPPPGADSGGTRSSNQGGQRQPAAQPQQQRSQSGYSNQAPAQRAAAAQGPGQRANQGFANQSRPAGGGSGFDDMGDDIPFVTSCMSYDMSTSKSRKMKKYGR